MLFAGKSLPRRGFTLLELIVVVLVLSVVALLAVPTFASVINKTTADVGLRTAEGIAREANALAVFNTGSSVNQTEYSNIESAVLAADLQPADGWTFEINSGIGGAHLSLNKNGDTQCWSITIDSAPSPDRAVAAELLDTTVGAAPPCPAS